MFLRRTFGLPTGYGPLTDPSFSSLASSFLLLQIKHCIGIPNTGSDYSVFLLTTHLFASSILLIIDSSFASWSLIDHLLFAICQHETLHTCTLLGGDTCPGDGDGNVDQVGVSNQTGLRTSRHCIRQWYCPGNRITIQEAPTNTENRTAFWQDNKRFYIRGIDYQPGGSSGMQDPLADKTVCERDLAQFKKLGINTIRVYTVDNSAAHDDCMNALADAGIYVIVDANNPLYSINRLDPAPSYNAKYLQSVFATVDAFAKYDNTLAFFSGNEVVNDKVESTKAARYVKATTRDMKQYMRVRKYRSVPVGYSATDVPHNRMQLAYYMNCGTDDERSDFFAFVSGNCQTPSHLLGY